MTITLDQYNRLNKIISKDCKIKHLYQNAEGQTCAIGALGREAGVLSDLANKNTQTITSDPQIAHAKKIAQEFGLTVGNLGYIQSLNDEKDDPTARRIAIKNYLYSLVDDREKYFV